LEAGLRTKVSVCALRSFRLFAVGWATAKYITSPAINNPNPSPKKKLPVYTNKPTILAGLSGWQVHIAPFWLHDIKKTAVAGQMSHRSLRLSDVFGSGGACVRGPVLKNNVV
jgi:hypothetical protein